MVSLSNQTAAAEVSDLGNNRAPVMRGGLAMPELCTGPSARRPLAVAFALLVVLPATAGTPERDKAWDALIAQAKKRGGAETPINNSISYVFQRPDGAYVSFTWMTDSPVRAVCVISKDQNLNVCGNWDTGKIAYGWRADANSPWTHSDNPPPKDAATSPKGPMDSLKSIFDDILEAGPHPPKLK